MRSARTLAKLSLLLLMMTYGSGCSLIRQMIGQVKTPQAKILSIKPELISLQQAVLHCDIAMRNPNPVRIKLAGLSYNFDIEGRQVARGTTRKGLLLRSMKSSRSKVDVKLRLDAAAQSLLDLLAKGEVPYTGTFELVFDTPVGKIKVPLAHRGRLPLPKAPPVVLQKIQLQSIGPQGLSFLCQVRVANPNPFATPIDKLQLGLTVNGRKLSMVSTPRRMMQPGQSLVLPLTVHASLQNVGLTVLSLAQRPRLNYEASLNFASGPLRFPLKKKGRLAW